MLFVISLCRYPQSTASSVPCLCHADSLLPGCLGEGFVVAVGLPGIGRDETGDHPQPVWTGTTRTMESKDIRAATEGFAKPVIGALKKAGLI